MVKNSEKNVKKRKIGGFLGRKGKVVTEKLESLDEKLVLSAQKGAKLNGRVIVVYNPRSSQAGLVEMEVIDPARKLRGRVVGKFAVQPTNVDDNAKNLAKILLDGDRVVSAGGDGTATIALNGVMRSGKDVSLAVLPYGNFNDMARLFRVRNFAKAVAGEAVEAWPLEVSVNGKLWRYAMCYASVGMMAESAEVFDNAGVRKKLRAGRGRMVLSLFAMFKWWLKHRKKRFLSKFSLNGHKIEGKMTDYLAVNGKTVAKILKMKASYKKEQVFYGKTLKLSGFFRATWFFILGMSGKMKMTETSGDTLEFATPARVQVQAEGEYEKIEGVLKIEMKKAGKSMKMVRG